MAIAAPTRIFFHQLTTPDWGRAILLAPDEATALLEHLKQYRASGDPCDADGAPLCALCRIRVSLEAAAT